MTIDHDKDDPLCCDTCLFTSCSVNCFNEDIAARKMCKEFQSFVSSSNASTL
jgi:hypothetical protein